MIANALDKTVTEEVLLAYSRILAEKIVERYGVASLEDLVKETWGIRALREAMYDAGLIVQGALDMDKRLRELDE